MFRVPPFMLGDTSKTTYRNSEQLARAYLSGCLSTHLTSLEQRFARAFEFPVDYELKFDLSQLLRAEIDVRYAAYQTALNSAWQTINEVRAQEGLGPVDGGDEPHIQMQYVPLSQSGTMPAAPTPTPTTPPAPAPGDEPNPTEDELRRRAAPPARSPTPTEGRMGMTREEHEQIAELIADAVSAQFEKLRADIYERMLELRTPRWAITPKGEVYVRRRAGGRCSPRVSERRDRGAQGSGAHQGRRRR